MASYASIFYGGEDALDEAIYSMTASVLKICEGIENSAYSEIQRYRLAGNHASKLNQDRAISKVKSICMNGMSSIIDEFEKYYEYVSNYAKERAMDDISDILDSEIEDVEVNYDSLMSNSLSYVNLKLSNIESALIQIIKSDAILASQYSANNGISMSDASKMIITDMSNCKNPDSCFAGKGIGFRNYMAMLVDTSLRSMEREVYLSVIASCGYDVGIISNNQTPESDKCSKWEGVQFSITGVTSGLPKYSDILDSGEIFHPRCSHRVLAYDESIGGLNAVK